MPNPSPKTITLPLTHFGVASLLFTVFLAGVFGTFLKGEFITKRDIHVLNKKLKLNDDVDKGGHKWQATQIELINNILVQYNMKYYPE